MVEFLLLVMDLHTEDPNGMRNTINVFIFSGLSLMVNTKADMIVWWWDTSLDSKTLTSFTGTSMLMPKQRIVPIFGWEGST